MTLHFQYRTAQPPPGEWADYYVSVAGIGMWVPMFTLPWGQTTWTTFDEVLPVIGGTPPAVLTFLLYVLDMGPVLLDIDNVRIMD